MPAKTTKSGTTAVIQPARDPDAPRYLVAPNGLEPESVEEQEKNILAHGYSSPRDHFIYGPGDLTPSKLAALWGYAPETVHNWVKRGDWERKRAARLEKTPVEQGGKLATVDLTARRAAHTEQFLELYQTAAEKLKAEMQETHFETASATGGTEHVRKSGAQRKVEISALRELDTAIRVVLGMPTEAKGAFAGANITQEITFVRVNKPTQNRVRELPAPSAEEGEVLDG